jgi:flavin-dependent dehydrogenase
MSLAPGSLTLDDGSRVGIVGGGPAGSLFAYFLLTFAERMDMTLTVDIYEPRDFSKPGPAGCNMCGGIVSESLIQALAVEGISLPSSIVQRGIDSYQLHTSAKSVRIDTPLHEMRIAAIHRGGGPRDVEEMKWGGLDGHLLDLATELGASVIPARIDEVSWDDGRPAVHLKGDTRTYDLLVGATGVNSAGWQLFESLGFTSKKPETTKAYITELKLGSETISQHFGNSMHIFFLDQKRLDCAAMIPKGDYVTVCLLGDDIDRDLVDEFFADPTVQARFPPGWDSHAGACHCGPRINIREASEPFMDRVVLVGDCGVTRLYKDGIGAAYRTAKAAARTAVFSGISAGDFKKHYLSTYRSIASDNRYGWFTFGVVHRIKSIRPLVRGVTRMTEREQGERGAARRMSMILWDMFTGSAPYRDIFFRSLDPRFLASFAWASVVSALPRVSFVRRRIEVSGGQG